MKKRLYIKTAFLTLASAALLSSCLKDNSHYVDFAGSKPLVEFPAATGIVSGSNVVVAALDISATPTALPVMVNVAAPKPLTSALTVTVAVDPAALTAYNATNKTNYVLLPPADYTIPSLKVTVPANQNSANLIVNINTSVVDPTQSYILPLTIVDGGGQQISNYKTVLYNISAKNQYDGTYLASGDRLHPTLGDFTFSYTVAMGTSGATSIDGGALADLKQDLKLTVNPDNTVTVSSSAQPTTANSLGLVNKYDPSTKTFTLHYFYNTSAPRIITETIVKK